MDDRSFERVGAVAAASVAVLSLTGGLASVILGPIWWVSVARLLWLPAMAQVAGT